MRLFIADDSKILRGCLVEILNEIEGVEIIGQEGDPARILEAIDILKPDLVILDIQMPGGSGILVLEAIKKKEKPPAVIMFTNYPYLQYRKRCMDAGADYFFFKTTELEKLIEVVKNSVQVFVG